MAVCRTRTEAAQLLVKFHDEGHEDIEATDGAGHSIDERDLGTPDTGQAMARKS